MSGQNYAGPGQGGPNVGGEPRHQLPPARKSSTAIWIVVVAVLVVVLAGLAVWLATRQPTADPQPEAATASTEAADPSETNKPQTDDPQPEPEFTEPTFVLPSMSYEDNQELALDNTVPAEVGPWKMEQTFATNYVHADGRIVGVLNAGRIAGGVEAYRSKLSDSYDIERGLCGTYLTDGTFGCVVSPPRAPDFVYAVDGPNVTKEEVTSISEAIGKYS